MNGNGSNQSEGTQSSSGPPHDSGNSPSDSGTSTEESRNPAKETPDNPANDPLFVQGDGEEDPIRQIWDNRDLLVVGTVPGPDRIVGRDQEISSVANELRHLIHGSQPNHIVIYGETGTGKSLVSRHVAGRLVNTATARDIPSASVYVECKKNNTETRVARTIARSLNDIADKDQDIPRMGLGSAEYYDYAYDIIDEDYEGVIIVLDEIDLVDDPEGLLHELSRAREAGHSDAYIGIIAISNDIDFGKRLNARVQSSMRTSDFIFEPYQEEQIEQILENRKDAFREGVLQDGVVAKTAEIAADEHGDARKAVDVLRIAGDLAEKSGSDVVAIEHVEDAVNQAEVNRVKEIIQGTTPQSKLVLYTLGTMTSDEEDRFRTSEVFSRYETTCEDVDVDPISHDRVTQILNKLSLLGITESDQVSGGNASGVYLEHQLLRDKEVVMKAVIESDERLSELYQGSYKF